MVRGPFKSNDSDFISFVRIIFASFFFSLEPVHIQISLTNPLQIVLPLLRIQLLWNFTDANGQTFCNEYPNAVSESFVKTHVVECIQLEPSCTQQVKKNFIECKVVEILA